MNSPNLRPRQIRRRTAWPVIIAWVFVIGLLTAVDPKLDSVKSNHNDGPPADSMSMRAEALAHEEFGVESAPPAIIVVRSDSAATTREAATRIADEVRRAHLSSVADVVDASGVPGGGGLANEDGTAETVLVGTTGDPGGDTFRGDVGDLRRIADDQAVGGVEVAVTGPAGILLDAVKVFGGSDKVLLLGTLGLVVLLLFAICRSPVLVFVSLLGVGFAMRLAETTGALLADAGLMHISGKRPRS